MSSSATVRKTKIATFIFKKIFLNKHVYNFSNELLQVPLIDDDTIGFGEENNVQKFR